jgi:DNA-binding transcriptional ArsR family regulator
MVGSFKERVLTMLDEKSPASISEISRGLDESKEFVSGYLHALTDCELLIFARVGRAKVFLKRDGIGTTIQRFSVNTVTNRTKEKVK